MHGGGQPRGLAVLAAKGMAAFLRIAAALTPAPARRGEPALAALAGASGAMEQQIVRILAGMVLAHAP